MNITVLANRDLASNLALNYLLPELSRDHRLRVFLSETVGRGEERAAPLEELKFFEQTLFNDLLFPLIDQGGLSGQLLTFRGLGAFTEAPVSALNRINSPDSLARLGAGRPDLVLSIRYGGILREAAIGVARLGVLNLHSGLLPDYRGVMATFRALLAGEQEVGATIHYITDPGIDTGAIVTRTRLTVVPTHSYLWHVLALYPPACEKLLACVAALALGETLPSQDQGEGGHYFSFPDEATLAEFRARGHSLVNVLDIAPLAARYSATLEGLIA